MSKHNDNFIGYLKSYITKKNIIIASSLIILYILSQFFMVFGFLLVGGIVFLFFITMNKLKNSDDDLLRLESNKELEPLENQLDEVNKQIIYIKQSTDGSNKKLNKWIQPDFKEEYKDLSEDDLSQLTTQRLFLLKKIESKKEEIMNENWYGDNKNKKT